MKIHLVWIIIICSRCGMKVKQLEGHSYFRSWGIDVEYGRNGYLWDTFYPSNSKAPATRASGQTSRHMFIHISAQTRRRHNSVFWRRLTNAHKTLNFLHILRYLMWTAEWWRRWLLLISFSYHLLYATCRRWWFAWPCRPLLLTHNLLDGSRRIPSSYANSVGCCCSS